MTTPTLEERMKSLGIYQIPRSAVRPSDVLLNDAWVPFLIVERVAPRKLYRYPSDLSDERLLKIIDSHRAKGAK